MTEQTLAIVRVVVEDLIDYYRWLDLQPFEGAVLAEELGYVILALDGETDPDVLDVSGEPAAQRIRDIVSGEVTA